MIQLPKQMLSELFERQAAIQTQIDNYTPIREVFDEFLKAGTRVDAGFLWWISPGNRRSRYNWERRVVLETASERDVTVEALTDPEHYMFGLRADDIQAALIGIKVSLPENQTVFKAVELPPVWAIRKQSSAFSLLDLDKLDLDKLGKDLEEIVPLVRACLSQD